MGKLQNNPPTDETESMKQCTIFTVELGDRVLFGNNEDNQRSPDETFIAFVPKQEIPLSLSSPDVEGNSIVHGFMLVGVRTGNRLYPQGGVNDQGLSYDINGLPPVSFNGQKGIPWRMWFNSFDILWNCSTVREVKEWFLTHQLSFSTWEGGQFHFADATGDAMILSIGSDGNYAFTWKENNHFIVSTNFNLANRYGGYPCSRFDTATKMLQEIGNVKQLTIRACADILDAVHIEYKKGVGTVYSNIYDLVNKRAYVYHLHNFDEVIEFDLNDELSRIESNDVAEQFKMDNGDLFSCFKGVRIHLINDLFSKPSQSGVS